MILGIYSKNNFTSFFRCGYYKFKIMYLIPIIFLLMNVDL